MEQAVPLITSDFEVPVQLDSNYKLEFPQLRPWTASFEHDRFFFKFFVNISSYYILISTDMLSV